MVPFPKMSLVGFSNVKFSIIEGFMCLLFLFHDFFQPFEFPVVGCKFHADIEPGRALHDGAGVAECVEAVFAVIGSCTAASYSSEGEVGIGYVGDDIVDACSAG